MEILPAEEDQPLLLVVDLWIPPNEPGFVITGCHEEMWYLPEERRSKAS